QLAFSTAPCSKLSMTLSHTVSTRLCSSLDTTAQRVTGSAYAWELAIVKASGWQSRATRSLSALSRQIRHEKILDLAFAQQRSWQKRKTPTSGSTRTFWSVIGAYQD